ncbi:pseudouridine synthase [Phycisphaeraceae bacterium D3-23]
MHHYTDNARGIRLQKAMAEAGHASRRACEELIEAGRVTVNGERVAELPAWVDPSEDTIKVDGQPLPRPRKTKAAVQGKRQRASTAQTLLPGSHAYIMVNKPRGVISTNDDPHGRKRVIDLIDPGLAAKMRLYPVGRLDADSTGLMVLTNDGDLTHRLTHPSFEVPKEYRVTVKGKVEFDDLERLQKGIYLATPKSVAKTKASESSAHKPGDERSESPDRAPGTGSTAGSPKDKPGAKKAAVEQVRILRYQSDREGGDKTMLAITLREGQNREIRRILARLGFKVTKLKRVALGPVKLKTLKSGNWRLLTAPEVKKLRKAAGLG